MTPSPRIRLVVLNDSLPQDKTGCFISDRKDAVIVAGHYETADEYQHRILDKVSLFLLTGDAIDLPLIITGDAIGLSLIVTGDAIDLLHVHRW